MKRPYILFAIYFSILCCGLVTAGCVRKRSAVMVVATSPTPSSTPISKSSAQVTKTKAPVIHAKQKSDRSLGAVVGRMTDFSEKPIAGATIEIIFGNSAGGSGVASTDKNGIYRLEGLSPGDKYHVHGTVPTAKAFDVWPRTDYIKVRSGKTKIVNLQGEMTPLHIRLISPPQNSVVKGKVIIKAQVSDNYGVQMIVLYARVSYQDEDDMLAGSEARYDNRRKGAKRRIESFEWDSTRIPNGKRNFKVTVYDLCGNESSANLPITVDNPN